MQRLNQFDNGDYNPGRWLKRATWYFISLIFFESKIFLGYSSKRALLRLYGGRIGKNVKIKPSVKIKYPWFLRVGDNSWIGEDVWIDNQAFVTIGSDVCISQGAYIFTGNHDFKRASFDLIISPIIIENQVWIGARAIICPGSVVGCGSVISVGTRITGTVKDFTIVKLVQKHEYRARQVV